VDEDDVGVDEQADVGVCDVDDEHVGVADVGVGDVDDEHVDVDVEDEYDNDAGYDGGEVVVCYI